jgi:hypothetical protein
MEVLTDEEMERGRINATTWMGARQLNEEEMGLVIGYGYEYTFIPSFNKSDDHVMLISIAIICSYITNNRSISTSLIIK